MQIVCERNALAGERGQVEIRFGDPDAPLLFRPNGPMARRIARKHVVCARIVCWLEEARRSEIGLAGSAQNAFPPRK